MRSLRFEGNQAVSDSRLRQVVVTQASGRLPWSPKHRFDPQVFKQDLARLKAFYADRGYPDASVTAADVTHADHAVSIAVRIREGAPVVVDAVRIEGFAVLPPDARPRLAALPIRAGMPYDRALAADAREVGARALADNGYPHGVVRLQERGDAGSRSVTLTLVADPGPKAYFGNIDITGIPDADKAIVRRAITFAPGDLFRASDVTRTQHQVSALQFLRFAYVTPRLADHPDATSVPVGVTAALGPAHRLDLGIGYGSEDRARGRAHWTNVNFLGGGRTASLDGRYSSIDRGVRTGLVQPHILSSGISLDLSARTWQTRQLTYDSQSYGGRAMLDFQFNGTGTGRSRLVRRDLRVGYVNEYLRYGIQAAALNDFAQREERIALGLDPDTGRGAGTLAAIDVTAVRSDVDNPLSPSRGTALSLHVQHAAPWLGGSYRFDEVMSEGHVFVPAGASVIASRWRIGTVAASDPATVPFAQRYFLGGSDSVRGWGRFQISPLNESGQPVGGRSLLELSTEWQFPIHGRVGGALFLDAGNVWAGDWDYHLNDLRAAVGPGVSLTTPIGTVRADLGIQLNPIPGLVINGKPESRHWRIHFTVGSAF